MNRYEKRGIDRNFRSTVTFIEFEKHKAELLALDAILSDSVRTYENLVDDISNERPIKIDGLKYTAIRVLDEKY